MGEFEDLRSQLAQNRDAEEELRTEALLAADAAKRAERRLGSAARSAGDDDSPRLEELAAEHQEAVRRAAVAREDLDERRRADRRLVEGFSKFTDPTKGISRLSDRQPILMFPLRLETRFKKDRAGRPQLWVRVYPDTCLVDGFEESLTENEVEAASVFWAGIWRAGGDEPMERAAWRDLVASVGAGRAGWVVRRVQPRNPSDKPHRDRASDILLVSVADGGLPPEAATFWEAAWRADGEPSATQAALAALETAVGAERAREIVEEHRPLNFTDSPEPPISRAGAVVVVRVLDLPAADDLQVRSTSWSSPPRVDLLPERFVLLAYEAGSPAPHVHVGNAVAPVLIAGPDPNAAPGEQLKPVGDGLQIPDDLAWMFDFERALEVGMAFRFDLTATQAEGGFERVLVLGVRVGDTAGAGARRLERLLEHHLYSRQGLEVIRQGTPTNATEQSGSGYTWRDDPDESFGPFFRQAPEFDHTDDVLLKKDGQSLSEALAISEDLAARIPGAGLCDRSEAQAMQIALWPSTLGYLMGTLLSPVFPENTVEDTRRFFTRHVSGRGPLPALRIGNQPYGIQPVTAFSRLGWFRGETGRQAAGYHARLYGVLRGVEEDWRPLVDQVSHVGRRDGDPHQVLLDVLGLHPTSAEYHPLGSDSLAHKAHELSFLSWTKAVELMALFPAQLPLALLRRFGYAGAETPELLEKIYRARQTPLDGPVVDDVPLSEVDEIRDYATGDRNYIEWLVDAAETGVAALQQEEGFTAGTPPAALLYLMLRHALQLSFRETGLILKLGAGVLKDLSGERREPEFVHVKQAAPSSESRYAVLFSPEEAVTRNEKMLLGDYIARHIRTIEGPLPEHLAALERLSGLPTARLERLFAEHIDTASYRFDAWKTGLLAWGLEQMRAATPQRHDFNATRLDTSIAVAVPEDEGIHLGAYGWLENLRPENKNLEPADLPDELGKVVNKNDPRPLMQDATNLGLVHAPSLGHATAAAVLRNGHVAHEGKLSVNLSSRRVRNALAVLEGMRGGQSLGALLGYQLERHVHDHGPLQVRALVYPLRRAFPLVANQIQSTATEEGEAKESIAAMNVVDGRKLLEHLEQGADDTYPFGLSTLPRRSAAEEDAVTAAVAHIRDVNDAVADLVLSEGVYQAVMGNFDRSAGTLDAFAKGNYPPEPDVVRTPRSGVTLTLRTAVHLPNGAAGNPLGYALTPLAEAEPALNSWLAGRLPAPADVSCLVSFHDRATGTERTETVTQADLGLHPIDLLYRLDTGPDQALSDLDERILTHLHASFSPRHDRPIKIRHTERIPGKVTWFELEALLRSLRRVLVAARALRPADMVLQGDVRQADQATSTIPRARLARAVDTLTAVPLPALATALADPSVTIDAAADAFAATVGQLAAYRIPGAGTGFAYEWRAAAYTAVVDKVARRVADWNERLARHDELMAEYPVLPGSPSDEDKLQHLRTAEVLISTQVTAGRTPDEHQGDLVAKRTDFVAKRDALREKVDVARETLAELVADVQAVLPLDAFDHGELDLTPDIEEIDRFRTRLRDTVDSLVADVARRADAADAALTAHDAAPEGARAEILQNGAKGLFGEDFVLVPRITLPAKARGELANAVAHSTAGGLTRHLTDPPPAGSGRDFPVDDWLHGVARVREKMHHWENVVLLSGALPGATAPELTPVQLPHDPAAVWLAMEFPAATRTEGDRLLYTASLAEPFDPSKPICGLVIDEWSEVIPAREETTGVAFHHDRPNAEPPQVWLLALPASSDGTWAWEDLVGAVNDALDSAKMRAIEPVHVDSTEYSAFLPATHSPWTYPEISISNNFLRNVGIYAGILQ